MNFQQRSVRLIGNKNRILLRYIIKVYYPQILCKSFFSSALIHVFPLWALRSNLADETHSPNLALRLNELIEITVVLYKLNREEN